MGIVKNGHIEDNKATPLEYWKYAGFSYLMANVVRPEAPRDSDGKPILQKGIVVLMNGYSSKEIAASAGGRLPDKTHEFLIFNWIERIQHTRFATDDEKKAIPTLIEGLSDEEISAIKYVILEKLEEIPHNDFDLFMSKINAPDEAAVVYQILKNHPVSVHFFKDSTDLI